MSLPIFPDMMPETCADGSLYEVDVEAASDICFPKFMHLHESLHVWPFTCCIPTLFRYADMHNVSAYPF